LTDPHLYKWVPAGTDLKQREYRPHPRGPADRAYCIRRDRAIIRHARNPSKERQAG